jgi:hypothetical protein
MFLDHKIAKFRPMFYFCFNVTALIMEYQSIKDNSVLKYIKECAPKDSYLLGITPIYWLNIAVFLRKSINFDQNTGYFTFLVMKEGK